MHDPHTHADYMMFHSTEYPPEIFSGPCTDKNCRRSSSEDFCIKCVMTLPEVEEWPSLTPEEAGMLSLIVFDRKVALWELWEVLSSPTQH